MDFTQTALTTLSMIGAALAWRKANTSAKAHHEAAAAIKRAEETLIAIQSQTDSLRQLAAQGQPPLLSARHKRGATYLLTNNSDTEVVIENVLNGESEGLNSDLTNTPIEPHSSVPFSILTFWSSEHDYALLLQCARHADPIRVPYEPYPLPSRAHLHNPIESSRAIPSQAPQD